MTRERYDELNKLTLRELLEPHVCTQEELSFMLESCRKTIDEMEFDDEPNLYACDVQVNPETTYYYRTFWRFELWGCFLPNDTPVNHGRIHLFGKLYFNKNKNR